MDQLAADAPNWLGLLVMAALVVGFGAMAWFLVIKPDRLNAKALDALAQRRGWTVTRSPAVLGRGFQVTVAPRVKAGWSCVITRQSGTGSGSEIRTTEFESARPLVAQGMVLIGPEMAGASAKTANKMLSQMGGLLEQMLLEHLLGKDAAAEAAGLRMVPDVAAGVTVFATEGVLAQDLAGMFVTLMADWRKSHKAERAFPILIATPTRTRLRLRTDASDPKTLEAFLGTALLLHEAVGDP